MKLLDIPFVLLPYIVPFTQVDQVSDRLGGQKLQSVDNLDLHKDSSVMRPNAYRQWDNQRKREIS
jgi:hypothetical protein